MIPIRVRKRVGEEEYKCQKCGNKVGHYVITKYGENDWSYQKYNYCQSCGEKVDWLTSKEEKFTIYAMVMYICGHFSFVRTYKVLHPEEYGNTVPVKQYISVASECPICEAKYKMDKAKQEYLRQEAIYLKNKKIQDSGENYFSSVTDEIKEDMFRQMMDEDNRKVDNNDADNRQGST